MHEGPEKVFLLWGKPAGELEKDIPDRHKVLVASHPSFYSFNKGGGGLERSSKNADNSGRQINGFKATDVARSTGQRFDISVSI